MRSMPNRLLCRRRDPVSRVTTSRSAELSVIALILLAAVVEHVVGNVPIRYIGPITMLGIAVTLTSFSLEGNFWRPKWADADPGINLLRCLIIGTLSIAALVVIFMGVKHGSEAWNGVG